MEVLIHHIIAVDSIRSNYIHAYCDIIRHLNEAQNSCLYFPQHIRHLCGGIAVSSNLGGQNNLHWLIQTLVGYTTVIQFHTFHMIYSKNCDISSVTIERIIKCSHQEEYCGDLPPWNETLQSLQTKLTLAVIHQWSPVCLNVSYSMTKKQEAILRQSIHFITKPYDRVDVYLPKMFAAEQITIINVHAIYNGLLHYQTSGVSHLPIVSKEGRLKSKYYLP